MSSSVIDSLTEDNQTRMASILETCLLALEQGEKFEPQNLLDDNPDLAEPLGKCLTTLMSLHAAVHGEDTQPAHIQPEVGGQLGEFVIEELIGRGGMGSVYRARQTSLGRDVAVKVLPGARLLAPTQLQRFQLETRAVAQLNHPHIVPIYSVGMQGDVHYYAMQLITGQSLDKVDHHAWTDDQYRHAVQCAIDMCDALQHAHSVGIIHRDIKPANLLLDRDGHIWITDFGLAQCRQDTRLTTSGDLVGTMNYMSPEQALGKPIDERTDIYSLGATLYEMLTGRQAFPGQVRPAVLRDLQETEPTAPRKLKANIPYDLETVVLKALNKDREARYASMQEMRDDLSRIQQGLPILGRRPTLSQRTGRWVKRHRWPVAIAAAGLATTSLSLVVGAAVVLLTRNELVSARRQSSVHLKAAEQNYWQGRNLVEHWNRDIVARLADVPGADELRATMLRDTVEYYRACIRDWEGATDDPRLSSDLVTARCVLAAALEQCGVHQEAIATYQQALEELQRVADRSSEDRLRTAITHNDLAVVLLHQQRTTEALDHLQSAISHLNNRSWTELNSAGRLARRDVLLPSVATDKTAESLAIASLRAAIEVNLARTQRELGNIEAEAAALDRAETAYRRLLAPSPTSGTNASPQDQPARNDFLTNGHYQSELATVLDQRALLEAPLNLEEAISLSGEAVRLHLECCQQTSPPLSWLSRLGASQHNQAVLQLKAGQREAGWQTLLAAIETKTQLVRRAGNRPTLSADLALTYHALGQLAVRTGSWSDARDAFSQARDWLNQALSRQSDSTLQQQLVETLNCLKDTEQHLGQISQQTPHTQSVGATP